MIDEAAPLSTTATATTIASEPTIDLVVNGVRHTIMADAEMPLLWVLRDAFDLTGTKFSCGIGRCGACTVLLDGRPTRSCQTPVGTVAAQAVTTIEGATSEVARRTRDAWLAAGVAQCGYCQPAQLLTAIALLTDQPHPSDDAIVEAFDGVLCRCATYLRIRAAVRAAGGS